MAHATSTPAGDQSYGSYPGHNQSIATIAYSQQSQYADPKKHADAVAYRNEKSKAKMNSMRYGEGKRPFYIAIGCFCAAVLFFVIGATVTGLYTVGRLTLGRDGSFIGPMLLVLGVLLVALGAYFMYRAQQISSRDRAKTKFHSEGFTSITASNKAFTSDESYKPKSGTASEKAVSSIHSTSFNNTRDATLSSLDTSGGSINRTPGIVNYDPQGPKGQHQQQVQQQQQYYYDNYAMQGYHPDQNLRRPKSHESLDSAGMKVRASLDDLYKPGETPSGSKGPETSSRKSATSNQSGEFREVSLESQH